MFIYYLFGAIVVLAFSVFLHIFIRYRRFGRLINKIPGLKPLPLLGNILSFNIPTNKIWIKVQELQDKYPIYKIWGCFSATVVTRDPDHIKIILSSKTHINKDVIAYNSARYFGNCGLVVLNGKVWENRRKMLNQAFSLKALEIYAQTLDKRVKRFTKELLTHDKTIVHDVSKLFMKFAFEVVCEATMDFDLDTVTEEMGNDFRKAIIEFGEICYYRVTRPYIRDWMMKFLPIGRRQQKLWKLMKGFAGKVVDERRKYLKSLQGSNVFKDHLDNVEKEIHDSEKVNRKNLSVLDVLLLNEEKGLIDSEVVVGETIIMIAAGFETTGVAMMFLIILLAENQKAQELAREELLDVVGGYNNDEIRTEHIKKLDYLERCAKESMRLFTVTPFIGRSIEEEVQLGKYTLPVGTELYISFFDLHRDPNLWHDPLRFDPDRFLPENFKQLHPFAYVPFSRGPRNCIGSKLAMHELKSVVAHILYNFHLEPIDRSSDFKFDMGVTLQVDRARVRFTKIENKF